MKACFKCGAEKPLTEFYKHKQMRDGHLNKCKICNKKDVAENRAKNIDYYREYDRQRFQEDPRVKARHFRYQATDAGRASIKKSTSKYRAKNPIKRGANIMVCNAVRDGKMIKPKKCSECGSGGRIHGHHDNYAFPLVVRWLCSKCHTAWHDKNGEGLNG